MKPAAFSPDHEAKGVCRLLEQAKGFTGSQHPVPNTSWSIPSLTSSGSAIGIRGHSIQGAVEHETVCRFRGGETLGLCVREARFLRVFVDTSSRSTGAKRPAYQPRRGFLDPGRMVSTSTKSTII